MDIVLRTSSSSLPQQSAGYQAIACRKAVFWLQRNDEGWLRVDAGVVCNIHW